MRFEEPDRAGLDDGVGAKKLTQVRHDRNEPPARDPGPDRNLRDEGRQEKRDGTGEIGRHRLHVEEEIEHRDNQRQSPEGEGHRPMQERLGQPDPVDEVEAVAEAEGTAMPPHDLHEAQGPAAPLGDVFLQAFRRETERKDLVEKDGAGALLLEPHRLLHR